MDHNIPIDIHHIVSSVSSSSSSSIPGVAEVVLDRFVTCLVPHMKDMTAPLITEED